MKLLLLLASITLANARILNKHNACEGTVVVNGVGHEKIILKDKIDKPYQLAIDYDTNILYFSYSTNDNEVFRMAYLNLKTSESGTISGIDSPFAATADAKSHKVYFGGGNGIYQLQPNTVTATNLHVTELNIWQLFSKDGILYFTTYPDEEAYLYKDGLVRKVTEIGDTAAMLIAVDNNYNIFFANSSGLFLHTKDGKNSLVGDYIANAFFSDIDGKLYFSTPTGIFKIEENTNSVTKLAKINNIYGLAIESDGSLIYAEENAIVRLKSTGQECLLDLDVYE